MGVEGAQEVGSSGNWTELTFISRQGTGGDLGGYLRRVARRQNLGGEIQNAAPDKAVQNGVGNGNTHVFADLALGGGPNVLALDQSSIQIEECGFQIAKVDQIFSQSQLHEATVRRVHKSCKGEAMDLAQKCDIGLEIAKSAGELALDYFRQIETLKIERKGPQDFVSEADKSVELHVRAALEKAFPEDGIVGEEHDPKPGTSGFTWVIDPIDGTTNFISSIPAWTVVLAGVSEDETKIGIIYDPCHDESFVALKNRGARLNGKILGPLEKGDLKEGSVGVGFSNRVDHSGILNFVTKILEEGGVFHRNASGALSLAYVSAGRLLGYAEEHMNAWDCLAGQLLVAEAGGGIEEQSSDQMIKNGGRVIVGAPGVYEALLAMTR